MTETTPLRPTSNRSSNRAVAISKALRLKARQVRSAGAVPTARGNIVVPQLRWGEAFNRTVRISFYAVVAAPIALSAMYFGFIASDRYVATTKFTVRAGDASLPEGLGGLAALSSEQPFQDTQVVANYIDSDNMIDALGRKLNLRATYSWSGADYLSRADSDDTKEEFTRYWNRHVDVNVDNLSNVLTVSVQAFTPHDALTICAGVLRESEKLVNQMSDREHNGALRDSMRTLANAQKDLEIKTAVLRDLRNKSGILDPQATSKVATQTVGELQEALANLQIQYSSQLRWVTPDAPQMRVLQREIDNTRLQIRQLANEVAGPPVLGVESLATFVAQFDKANLDLNAAQAQYVKAVAAVEKARAEAEAQRVYVLPFEEPTLPEKALYPERLLDILIVAGASLALWGAGIGAALLARDNLAF